MEGEAHDENDATIPSAICRITRRAFCALLRRRDEYMPGIFNKVVSLARIIKSPFDMNKEKVFVYKKIYILNINN